MRRRSAGHRGLRIPLERLVCLAPAVVLWVAGAAWPLAGQSELVARCQSADPSATHACVSLAQAAMIGQPRIALASGGGNPLPGSSSTLGMRIGSTPRVAVQLRATGAHASIPDLGTPLYKSLDADLAVGLLRGGSPAPTVGGVASLDLVGSLGFVTPSDVSGGGTAATGAVGLRLGVLRESFTAPGITVSGMYRRVGATGFGPVEGDATARLDHIDDVSVRAVVGKRLFALGTSAGVGWDHTSSDVRIAVLPTPVTGPLSQNRLSAFADLTWVSLVFSTTAELGWQRGGSPAVAPTATGLEDAVRKGGLFGSLAFRLTI